MKNVVLICDSYYPEKNSAAKLMGDLVMELTELDYHVSVYTINGKLPKYSKDKINIYSFSFKGIKSKSNLVRGLAEFWSGLYFIFCYLAFDRTKYSHVLFYNPTILQFSFVWFLKKISPSSKCFLILRDIFPDWAVEAGQFNSRILIYVLKIFQQFNFLLADRIFCESANKLKYIKGISKNRELVLLYNWVSRFKGANKVSTVYTKRLIYAGNIGPAQDIKSTIDFFKRCSANGWQVDFYSFGRDLNEFKALTSGIMGMQFFDPISQSELENNLNNYDAGLVFLAQGLTLDNIPGKLLTYWSAGLQVFGAVNINSELLDLINSNGLGFVTDNRDDFNGIQFQNSMVELSKKKNRQEILNTSQRIFSARNAAKTILGLDE